jgi:hypothetical protein
VTPIIKPADSKSTKPDAKAAELQAKLEAEQREKIALKAEIDSLNKRLRDSASGSSSSRDRERDTPRDTRDTKGSSKRNNKEEEPAPGEAGALKKKVGSLQKEIEERRLLETTISSLFFRSAYYNRYFLQMKIMTPGKKHLFHVWN